MQEAKTCGCCGVELKESVKRCGQCHNVRYCNQSCQVKHWPTHKANCRSKCAEEFFQLLQHKRGGLLEFLGRDGNGKRANLMKMFHQIEVSTSDPLALRRWSMHPSKINPIFEWPTDELCHCIHQIIKYENSSRILELGAGTGLLSARLNQFAEQSKQSSDKKEQLLAVASNKEQLLAVASNQKPKLPLAVASNQEPKLPAEPKLPGEPLAVASNPSLDLAHCYSRDLFISVEDHSMNGCRELGTPVMLAWIDPSAQDSFGELIARNKPKFILAIGEPFDFKRRQEMKKEYEDGKASYSITHITAKQLCHHDRTLGNEVTNGATDSRSILYYYRLNQPSLTPDKVVRLCGAANLGTCASMDDQNHQKLIQQDYQLNLKHDSKLQLSCANPLCHGCPYQPAS